MKLSLFADITMLYRQNPKVSPNKLLELMNEFSKVASTRLIYRTLLLFYVLTKNYQKEKLRKNIPFIMASKRILRNKLNQGG